MGDHPGFLAPNRRPTYKRVTQNPNRNPPKMIMAIVADASITNIKIK